MAAELGLREGILHPGGADVGAPSCRATSAFHVPADRCAAFLGGDVALEGDGFRYRLDGMMREFTGMTSEAT